MLTHEQFAEKQAKERVAFEREAATAVRVAATGIPIPDYIGGMLYGALGLTYRNSDPVSPRSLADALELMKKFSAIVPFNVLRDVCTIMAPEKDLPEKDRANGYKRDTHRNSGAYVAHLDVRHINDSTAPTSARLGFFARAGGMLFNVSIEFGTGYIGACPQMAPVRKETRNARGHIESATFATNSVLSSMADSVLSYGSGDMGSIKKSADHRYLCLSDRGDDDCAPCDCSHALEQLQNIADNLKA